MPDRRPLLEHTYGWIDDPNFPPYTVTGYLEHLDELLEEDTAKANEEALYFFARMTWVKNETGETFYVNKHARLTPNSLPLKII